MQEALRQWCLWWVCLTSAVTVSAAELVVGAAPLKATKTDNAEQCKVLELSLEHTWYPMPTNLTIKPLSRWWHLKFTLSVELARPIACILLEDGGEVVDVSMYTSDCDSGSNVYMGYLTKPLEPQKWTTFGLSATSSAVLVQEPQGGVVTLSGNGFTLPLDGLQMMVMEAWGLEAAVGCSVSCPVHHHAAEGSDMKKRVRKWEQESLHFHFRPGSSFSKLQYEVKCTTKQNTVFRHEVLIKPGEAGVAGKWHLVELEQRQSNVTARLNDKLLDAIQLPESCINTMHVLWTVGDGSFGFNCTPKGAEKTTQGSENPPQATQQGGSMHPGVAVGITLAVVVVVQGGVFLAWRWMKKRYSNTTGSQAGAGNAMETTLSEPPRYSNTTGSQAGAVNAMETTLSEPPVEQNTNLCQPSPKHTEGRTMVHPEPAPPHAEGRTKTPDSPPKSLREGRKMIPSEPPPAHTTEGSSTFKTEGLNQHEESKTETSGSSALPGESYSHDTVKKNSNQGIMLRRSSLGIGMMETAIEKWHKQRHGSDDNEKRKKIKGVHERSSSFRSPRQPSVQEEDPLLGDAAGMTSDSDFDEFKV